MDPFSHFLLGYLITFGVWGPGGIQYVTAGALAGGLPDGDILLYPISGRFPLLRHRGVSHSIVGVTVIAAAGTFLVPALFSAVFGAGFAAGSPVFYFVAMEAGGLSHVFLDSLDHWSVPIFAPFSKREYHFDAERIFNLGAMIFTVAAYGAMLYERGRTPIWVWSLTAWILLALVLVYFAIRLTARWRAGVVQHREGYTAVIPQLNPLVFLLVDERSDASGRSIRFARYHLRRGFVAPPQSLLLPAFAPGPGPVMGPADALHRSHGASVAASWILGETHHFGQALERSGGYEVHWYSLEMVFWGRAPGVIARVDGRTGEVNVRTTWRVPGRIPG